LISEVLFDPATSGNDAAEEWLNCTTRQRGPCPTDWQIGDREGGTRYRMPLFLPADFCHSRDRRTGLSLVHPRGDLG
jgi:hypothetical protein